MMTTGLVLLALAAAPIKVAVTRLNVVDLSDSRGDFYTEHLAGRLADEGLEVTTQREIAALLGLERQKQIIGCAEEGACLAEIAAALGVDGIALGDVARVGSGFQLNVKIVSSKTGKRLASFSTLAKSEDELLSQMSQASQVMARKLSEALGQALTPAAVGVSSTSPSGGLRRWWWVPAIVGAGAGAGGAIGLASAETARVRLSSEQLEQGQAQQILDSGKTARVLGYVGVGVGVAALGTALGFLILGDDTPPVVPSASLQGGNPTVVLSGVFP